MRVAVLSTIYNEERNIRRLLDSLFCQTRAPDEIILVDDGSTDNTAEVVSAFKNRRPPIRYIQQKNQGPARARNVAWKNSNANICIFTDGDCEPEPDWIETLLKPFDDPNVGASAGTYKTLNPQHLLAEFIGDRKSVV